MPKTPERDIFAGQVHIRQGRNADAVLLLSELQARNEPFTLELRARTHAKLAAAFAGQGNAKQARHEIALIGDTSAFEAHARVEVEYDDAVASYMTGDYARVADLVDRNRNADTVDPIRCAGFTILRGALCGVQSKYREQATHQIEAIERLCSNPEIDIGMVAAAAHSLAALAREVSLPEAAPLLSRLERELAWTDDLGFYRFQVARALAWTAAVNGEYIAAFRRLNRAERLVDSEIAGIWSHIDRCKVAFISGQHHVANAELDDAIELISQHDWSHMVGDEAVALIMAAELLAQRCPMQALELTDRAEQLHKFMLRNMAVVHEQRFEALVSFSRATAYQAMGNDGEAQRYGESAFTIFAHIEHNWRAAQAALLLYNITHEQKWLQQAEEHCKDYPRSFVATRVQASAKRVGALVGLTERQVEIVAQLKEGKRIEEVGQDLGISPNTVRIHIGKIHRALGVKSRAQLLAKLTDVEVARPRGNEAQPAAQLRVQVASSDNRALAVA